MTIEFSAPFNWCDSRCQYCPLLDECAVGRRLRGSRWVHEMRGEDPDDPSVAMRDVAEALQRSVEMLASIADVEGAGRDERATPPASLVAPRLCRAARGYAVAVHKVLDEGPRGLPDAEEANERAMAKALLVGAKIARISGYDTCKEAPDDETWIADGVPNLLLIERAIADVAAALASIGASPEDPAIRLYEQASSEIQRVLAPWIAAIPAEARSSMAALIASGHAPSPFCTTER